MISFRRVISSHNLGYNDQIWPVWKAETAKEMAGTPDLWSDLFFMQCKNSYLVYKHLNPNEKVYYPAYKEHLIGELVRFVRAPRNSAGRKTKLEKERFRLQNVGEHFLK